MLVQTEDKAHSHFDATKIERPDRSLLTYYILVSLCSGPAFPFVMIPLWLRYLTLRYKFDHEGVSMCWGILFRREIYLTYRRLQDIHLTANVIQRWMGLSKISLQTASGKSEAEMAIEGVLEADDLRDFLYSKMRGSRDQIAGFNQAFPSSQSTEVANPADINQADPTTRVLEEIRDALKLLVAQKTAGKF